MTIARRLPIGAETGADGTAHLRVWAPDRHLVRACLVEGETRGQPVPLEREAGGYHSGTLPGARAGAL
jgi:hypothetical protein